MPNLLVPLLLLALQAQKAPDVEVIHRASADEPIAFVHIVSESPSLVLGAYGSRELYGVWPRGTSFVPPNPLLPEEIYVIDEWKHVLAKRQIGYPCLDASQASGLAQFTQLHFARPILPDLPPPPQPNPPPVDGANMVHISADAALIVLVRLQHDQDQDTTVHVYRRSSPSAKSYEWAGTYLNHGQGEVRTSLGGNLIAQREGRDLRLLAPDGTLRARVPLEGAFDLAPEGGWLGRTTSQGAIFTALDANGVPTGAQVSLPTATVPFEIKAFPGGLAIVLERTTATLFDVNGSSVVWSRSTTVGIYVSADLDEIEPGRRAIGLGRRELLRAPMRRNGAFEPGRALAYVDAVDVDSDATLFTTSFEMTTWDYGVPRVSFAGGPARVLVTTPEVAWVSNPLL